VAAIPQGWGCSNTLGRTVTVNGTVMKTPADEVMGNPQGDQPPGCGDWPLPAKVNGYYFFEFSAGTHTFTSFYWY
jgi:hypothetical protein